ncbi:hypothetical protein JTE90_006010 [Oedothorax gibbosus]|uniref:Uncharacterized protein n=1 Tax=Oedothorax gibbosus TaxID=931172 RepID=A0AAV6TI11_9ARAC|nr:hypothetical protein JTE90_006010 [Oedothorax gibbosus]
MTIDLHVEPHYGHTPEFPLASSCPGLVPIFRRCQTCAAQTPPLPQVETRRVSGAAPPRGERGSRSGRPPRPCYFISPPGYYKTQTSRTC